MQKTKRPDDVSEKAWAVLELARDGDERREPNPSLAVRIETAIMTVRKRKTPTTGQGTGRPVTHRIDGVRYVDHDDCVVIVTNGGEKWFATQGGRVTRVLPVDPADVALPLRDERSAELYLRRNHNMRSAVKDVFKGPAGWEFVTNSQGKFTIDALAKHFRHEEV